MCRRIPHLHGELAGLTPTDAPGAKTLRTVDFVRLLAECPAIVIDTMTYFWGQSIPGAVGLKYAGLGGNFADAAQDRLGHKLRELTAGDFTKPIVAVGWNSERFDGRNLALRLAALGYTQVDWYRGGREAWEVERPARNCTRRAGLVTTAGRCIAAPRSLLSLMLESHRALIAPSLDGGRPPMAACQLVPLQSYQLPSDRRVRSMIAASMASIAFCVMPFTVAHCPGPSSTMRKTSAQN